MKKRGFTLIELLMVSAILSLLMSVVFFRVTEAKKKGEDAHMKAESAEVAKAVYQYKEDNGGKVPGALSVTGPATLLEGSQEFGGADYIVAMQELVDGGYLSEIPYSPSGDDYTYIISADGTEAVFAADLNYEESGGGSSGARNSCQLTYVEEINPEEPQYPENASYVYYGCTLTDAASCPNPGQTDDTHSCFAVTEATINANCECGFSVNAYYPETFPVSICYNHVYLDTVVNENTGEFEQIPWSCNYNPPAPVAYYSCEHDPVPAEGGSEPQVPGICDGLTDTDYCTCL